MSRLALPLSSLLVASLIATPALASPVQLGATSTVAVVATPPPTPEVTPSPPVAPVAASIATAGCITERERRARTKTARGLLISGLMVGGAAYLLTSMSGALALDRARDFEDDPLTEADESARGDQRRAFGRALLVPIGGPFLAIPRADTALRAWGAGIAGVAQGVGLGLTIAGIVGVARGRRAQRVAVAPTAGPDGGGVTMAVRF